MELETFDVRKLTYPVMQWVVGKHRTSYDGDRFVIGAITNRFSQKVRVDSNKSTFFWDNCLNCPQRWSFECRGGNTYSIAEYQCTMSKSWYKSKVETLLEISHPPLLTFLSHNYYWRRYTYNILPEHLQSSSGNFLDMTIMSYCRINGDSRMRDHETPGYICLGSVGKQSGELFFFEYDRGSANSDLCIRNYNWSGDYDEDCEDDENYSSDKEISLEDWIQNYESYVQELVDSGEELSVGEIFKEQLGPCRYNYDWYLASPEQYPIIKFRGNRELILCNDEGEMFDWNEESRVYKY